MRYLFKKELYSKEAVIKAAYRYTDKAYLHLDSNETEYTVNIEMKEGNDQIAEKEFRNTLLAEMVRLYVNDRTSDIRKLIMARAFSSTMIDEDKAEEPEDIDTDIDTILTDWFEINEQNDAK